MLTYTNLSARNAAVLDAVGYRRRAVEEISIGHEVLMPYINAGGPDVPEMYIAQCTKLGVEKVTAKQVFNDGTYAGFRGTSSVGTPFMVSFELGTTLLVRTTGGWDILD